MRLMAQLLLAFSLVAAGAGFAQQVPRPAGEFAFEFPGGKTGLVSNYRGKVVMLAFFSTTCPHCQDTSRVMERLQAEFGAQGFQAVGVCFNDMAKLLTPEFIKAQKLTYPVGYANPDSVLQYVKHPAGAIPYVPMLVFIDRKGVIQYQYPGQHDFWKNQEANMRANIQTLLKGGAASAKPAPKPAAPAPAAKTKKAS